MEQGIELFAESLFAGDIARLPSSDVEWCDSPGLRLIVSNRDARVRLEAPGVAPEFDLDAALWAGGQIYAIAKALCHRNLGSEWLAENISPGYPAPLTVEIIYSADLFLGYLPAMGNLIRRVSTRDPLMDRVAGFASCWPLSTAGMEIEHEVTPCPEAILLIQGHSCLSRMWEERK